MKKRTPKPRPRGMTLEQALPKLRKGATLRRRAWHTESKIVRVDDSVFVVLPRFIDKHGVPQKWQPYPSDFLARDWEVLGAK